MAPSECPICRTGEAQGYPGGHDLAGIDCKVCGVFKVSGTLLQILRAGSYAKASYKLSGMTRRASELGGPLTLTTDTIQDILKSAPQFQTPFDVLDRLLLVLHEHLTRLTGGVHLTDVDYPLVFAHDVQEFREFVGLLESMGWITAKRQEAGWDCFITLSGWSRVAELRQVGRQSDRAFVAMWFDPTLSIAWSEGIEPALREAGYTPIRVDRVEYNDKIDDRIIAEIRQSGLLVADFTGNRGGVYYEAGFARGLGLPVISTVRQDELEKVHFDTRQYNHIVWENPSDLRERLHYRVLATLGPARPSAPS